MCKIEMFRLFINVKEGIIVQCRNDHKGFKICIIYTTNVIDLMLQTINKKGNCLSEFCYLCNNKASKEELDRVSLPEFSSFLDAESYLIDQNGERINCVIRARFLLNLLKLVVVDKSAEYKVAINDYGTYICRGQMSLTGTGFLITTISCIKGLIFYSSFKFCKVALMTNQ